MSLSKPPSAFTAGLVIVSLAACLCASAAAAESKDHKPAVVMHAATMRIVFITAPSPSQTQQ